MKLNRTVISGSRENLDKLLDKAQVDLQEYGEATFGAEGNGPGEPESIIVLQVDDGDEEDTGDLLAEFSVEVM